MSPILILGRNGQLARALAAAAGDTRSVSLGRADIDLWDETAVAERIEELRPSVIVNTAAYTAVDAAEGNAEAAFALNARAPGVVAHAAARHDAPLIHISTDYVFSGDPGRPWREDDPIEPRSVYGRSKAQGEEAVLAAGGRVAVVRTSWLYGATGGNFLATMLRLGESRDVLSVVDDQTGAPTYVADLAQALLTMAPQAPQGIYHLAHAGMTTWFGFASAIFEEARARGWPVKARLETTTTERYGAPAPRPAWSVLDCGKARRDFSIALPDWKTGLSRCMAALAERQGEITST
ncbi:MAG: dTDP-4-dehydrorhamnose reductase [Rhodobiaceae bacterium]|nr:dTDP-4-dehydrorhamnose reductase [Rhodobiaceae bacterium]